MAMRIRGDAQTFALDRALCLCDKMHYCVQRKDYINIHQNKISICNFSLEFIEIIHGWVLIRVQDERKVINFVTDYRRRWFILYLVFARRICGATNNDKSSQYFSECILLPKTYFAAAASAIYFPCANRSTVSKLIISAGVLGKNHWL